jgi:hypothetical protein
MPVAPAAEVCPSDSAGSPKVSTKLFSPIFRRRRNSFGNVRSFKPGVNGSTQDRSFVLTGPFSFFGYVERENMAIEYRPSHQIDRLPEFAVDWFVGKRDVIVAGNTSAVFAAKAALSLPSTNSLS